MNYQDIINSTREDELVFNSPYRFIKTINRDWLVQNTVINPIIEEIKNRDILPIYIVVEGKTHIFLLKKLVWDSSYFGFPNYKIIDVFYTHDTLLLLSKAVLKFKQEYCTEKRAYYYIDTPSEKVLLTQALNINGFRLVESRLHYFYENIQEYSTLKRYPVRLAKINEAGVIGQIAKKMQNKFDRLHSDGFISNEIADNYIEKFAKNSVEGFADYVLATYKNDIPFGFLASNKPQKINGHNVSQLVLAAIDNSIEKGWLYKLLSETIFLLKNLETDYLTTITQTSNISAFKTWEKFGFKLGFVSNILVFKND
jgi:dTDP-4-amino-4,6-dideoxy-D-galactose acyltransferase